MEGVHKKNGVDLKELEKLSDKIFIDVKETSRIFNWAKQVVAEHEDEMETEFLNKKRFFPLSSFYLSWQVKKNFIVEGYFELVDYDPTHFRCYLKEGEIYVRREPENARKYIEFNNNVPGKTKQEAQEYASAITDYFQMVMIYICDHAEQRRHVLKEAKKNNPDASDHEKKEREYHDRELFFLNDIVEFVSEHPTKRSIHYLKDVWGVRGHLRHLQNGDVIFIKPFKKGRMRLTKEPENRTYLIERKEINEQNTD